MVRKMALIPADVADFYSRQAHTPTAPTLNQLSVLDHQMRSILDDPKMEPALKIGQYYNILRRYDTLLGTSEPSFTYTTKPVSMDTSEKKPPLPVPEESIIRSIPKTQQRNVRLLLEHIKDNPDLAWTESKELMYRGEKIPGSNIYDLISDITRNRKHQTPARGWREFTQALVEQNVPEGAIGNKQRLEYIRKNFGMSGREITDETMIPIAASDEYETPGTSKEKTGKRRRLQTDRFSPSRSDQEKQHKKKQKQKGHGRRNVIHWEKLY